MVDDKEIGEGLFEAENRNLKKINYPASLQIVAEELEVKHKV